MEGTRYTTPEAVLKRASEAKGLTFNEIDKTGRLATGKGAIGTVIEESWFGYSPNSESEPDFPEAGVDGRCNGSRGELVCPDYRPIIAEGVEGIESVGVAQMQQNHGLLLGEAVEEAHR